MPKYEAYILEENYRILTIEAPDEESARTLAEEIQSGEEPESSALQIRDNFHEWNLESIEEVEDTNMELAKKYVKSCGIG